MLRWLFLGMLVLVIQASLAAPVDVPAAALPTPQFRRFGTAEGLPSSSVYAVVQDPTGAMWFGTKGGLARYDGVQFEVFHHVAGDPGSLGDNGIGALMIDRRGRLWAAGLEAGLNRYRPDSGSFEHWRHDASDPASLSSDKVWTMAQAADGQVWVGTVEGLDRMLPDGRHFEHIQRLRVNGQARELGAVSALYVDSRQRLWIGSEGGVFRRDPDGRITRIRRASGARPIDAWSFDQDPDGRTMRIATGDGLYRVGDDDVAQRFDVPGLSDNNVMSSVRDAAGRLWVGTQKGLFLQMRRGAPWIPVVDEPVLYGDLPGTWVWKMLPDREGGLWITTFDGGVAYLAPGWHTISRYTHIPDDPDSLRDSIATAVAHGSDERVWVGERDGRVDKLDPGTGRVEHILSGLYGDVVGMTEDPEHNLWIATKGALYRYGTASGKLDRVDPQQRLMSRPLEVEQGPDHRLYARTFNQGVFRIDQHTLDVSPVPMRGANERAPWGSQMTLRFGIFWYAGDGGLLQLDASHDHFQPVPGVRNDRAVDAFDTSADGFWLARPDGLEHYHRDRDEEGLILDRTVRSAQGWPSINVVDLRIDAKKRVWIFGSDGLWRFDPDTGRFRRMGLQDGLTNGEFFRGYSRMADGNIYAPTYGGVIGFDPDRVLDRQGSPPLMVTAIRARRDGVMHDLPTDGRTVDIDWRDREVSVVARVFSYIDPAANRYRFRMVGLDPGWVEAGSRGEREFAGLPSGDYTLQVMGAGASDHWAALTPPLRIHVEAPPWMRWWAWLGYAAVGALLAMLGLWLWQRRLAERHRLALSEQQRQLAEQASAAKTRFLATLSHEIRTPMTGVIGMAELLLATPLRDDQNDYAHAMQRSGAMLLKLLNDALDLARIEAGRLELEPAPFDLRELLEDVADLTDAQAQAKRIPFSLELSPTLPAYLLGDAVRLKQILLNLTSNAVKFTERGQVVMSAKHSGDGVLFEVRDTGPGIPEASQSRLFQRFEQGDSPQRSAGSGLGLAICRELVNLMHGRIELISKVAQGSTFRVWLPLEAATPVAPPAAAAVSLVAGRYRVLLVEDDAIVAAVVRGLLEKQGHTVTYVGHGLAALAELATVPFDLMLLDLDLPGVDGFQVARLVRQRERDDQHLPIIAITARSGGGEESCAREAGMDGFLRKPVSGAQLARAMEEVLADLLVARGDA